MKRIFCVCSMILCAASLPVQAIDHGNLDENRPLRVEDAYPIAAGEFALELGTGYIVERRGSNRAILPVEVLYGAYSGLQLGVGTLLSTNPRDIEGPHKSGDVHLSALYNFNQETLSLPAFGLKFSLGLPTGVGSSGADLEVKGLMTKSIGRMGLHFNPAYMFIGDSGSDERDGRYSFTLGGSYPVGAPNYTRLIMLWDVFIEQSHRRGESEILGAGAGLRYQLTYRSVLDFGASSEFAGPEQRATFSVRGGISIGF